MKEPKVNGPLLVASVFISVLLWTIVYPQNLPDEATRPFSIPLTYEGLPPNLVITEVPDRIAARARGNKNKLDEIDEKRLEAIASLAEATPGRRRYPVTLLPPSYQRDFFGDDQFTAPFTIEEVVTRKLEVRVETLGQFNDNNVILDETLPDPGQVEASGPKSVIDRLATARVRLDLAKVDTVEPKSVFVGVEAVLADGSVPETVEVSPKLVKLTPILATAPQEKPVTVVANIRGTPAAGFSSAGYEITPKQVTLRGRSLTLASVTRVTTQPVDLTGIDKTTTFTVGLRVPAGTSLVGTRTVRVRVLINPVQAEQPQPPPPQ